MVTVVVILAGVCVVAIAGVPTDAREPSPNTHHLTFTTAVQLPGVTLTPGTYTFEAGFNGHNLNLVHVTTADGRSVLFHGLTVSVSRPANGPTVTFDEAPSGMPDSISTWYEHGGTAGHAFIYYGSLELRRIPAAVARLDDGSFSRSCRPSFVALG